MTDEYLMRIWTESHDGFSADFDRGILKLDNYLRGRPKVSAAIEPTYASRDCAAAPARAPMSATARAALAGVTACLATMGLLLTVGLLTTADLHAASAYPVPTHTIVA